MWVFEEFEKSVAQYGDHPFLHIPATATVSYSGTTIDLTYAQSSSLVGELKTLFSGRGYGLGHRVGLVLDNRAEFFLHFFALNALGVSVVPISSELPLDDMSYLLSHSDIGVIIALPMHLEQTATAASTLDMPVAVVSNDNLDELPEAVMPVGIGKTTSTTEAAMVYTSGTTGKPKGCMLSNEYFVSLGQWYKELGGLCAVRAGKERLITPLPLNHMNALACSSMAVMMTGGCLIQLDRFHPSTWWQTVRESKASIIHYLGVMPAMLLNTPPAAHDNLGDQIRFGFGAGADPAHQEAFEKRFGFPLIEAWAMTETGAGACLTANHEPRHVARVVSAGQRMMSNVVWSTKTIKTFRTAKPVNFSCAPPGMCRNEDFSAVITKTRLQQARPGVTGGSTPAMSYVSVKTIPFTLLTAVKTSLDAVARTSPPSKSKACFSSTRLSKTVRLHPYRTKFGVKKSWHVSS